MELYKPSGEYTNDQIRQPNIKANKFKTKIKTFKFKLKIQIYVFFTRAVPITTETGTSRKAVAVPTWT